MRTTEEYMNSMHRLGRIGAIGAIIVMLGIPTVMALAFDSFPGFGPILLTSAGLLAVFLPIAISEVVSFTPVLGSSIYLTLITGNVMNLKLPTALNAMELTNVEQGTEKGDIVSGIAVATSSIVTIIIIACSVALMVPLKPILMAPSVQTATHYILPALFGGLSLGALGSNVGGGVKIKGRLKAAVIPAVMVAGAYMVSPFLVTSLQGVFILIAIPIIYFSAKFLYKKGKIVVILPTDEAEGTAEEKKPLQETN